MTDDDFEFCEECQEIFDEQNGMIVIYQLCEDCQEKILAFIFDRHNPHVH